jgi:hypothetical protein
VTAVGADTGRGDAPRTAVGAARRGQPPGDDAELPPGDDAELPPGDDAELPSATVQATSSISPRERHRFLPGQVNRDATWLPSTRAGAMPTRKRHLRIQPRGNR